jgi:FkbM family methyltransferase
MPDRHAFITRGELQPQEVVLKKIYDPSAAITILDIGACEGESSVRYSKMFPNARIFAFEPLQKNIELIERHIEKYHASNVSVKPVCLSDRIGTVEFHVSSGTPEKFKDKDVDWNFGNKSSSILPAGGVMKNFYPWLNFMEKVEVPSTTVSQFMSDEGLKDIDFVHMDVQGAELIVLRGADLNVIKAVWLEIAFVELYKGQPLRKDIEKYFRQRGFIKLIERIANAHGDQFWIQKKIFFSSPLLILTLLRNRTWNILFAWPKRLAYVVLSRAKKTLL